MEYAELDDGKYTSLRKDLLREKGGPLQDEFLDALEDSDKFMEFMRAKAPFTNGEHVAVFRGALTESSFKDPPKDIERDIYDLWKAVSPKVACRASFWGAVTARHIEEGAIAEPLWLAANGSANESGGERIDKARAQSGEDRAKGMDACVRTALRRMSGLPEPRGNRTVFVDTPFGRAWWRERMVARIEKRHGAEDRASLLRAVRVTQTYWERLVVMIVSRGSVFGSEVAQDAFINSLAKRVADPKSPLRSSTKLTTASRRFSNIAAARELGALEFHEIGAIADALLDRI